jgi:hypothetical protein
MYVPIHPIPSVPFVSSPFGSAKRGADLSRAHWPRPSTHRFRPSFPGRDLVSTLVEPFFDPLEDLDGLNEISVELGLVLVFRVHRAHRPLECVSIYIGFDEQIMQERIDLIGNFLIEGLHLRVVKFARGMIVFDHGIPNAVDGHQQSQAFQMRLVHFW